MVRDHGQAERAWHALHVRLAVGSEPEHRLDQRLELQRGADLCAEAQRLFAGVPELVRRAVIDQRDLARTELKLLASALHAEPSFSKTSRSPVMGLTIVSPARIMVGAFLSSGVERKSRPPPSALRRRGGRLPIRHEADFHVVRADERERRRVLLWTKCCTLFTLV
jgi:hypothetical protein